MADIIQNTEIRIKQKDGSDVVVHPITKEENIIPAEGKTSLRESKFDDVETYVDEDSELNVINFKANGKVVKTIKLSGGGGLQPGTLSTTLESRFTMRENEVLVIPYTFNTPNRGTAHLYVSIICGEKSKELEYTLEKIGVGSVNIGSLDKGINQLSIYAVDYMGQMTNVINCTVVCGSIEITSSFDDEQDFNTYASIQIPFNVSALDKNATMVLKINVDGVEYTTTAVEGYNTYVFPSENKTTGVHPVTLQVFSDEFKSNILEFNVVVVDANKILISSKQANITVEEGTNVDIKYRISTIGQNMFSVKYYLDSDLMDTVNGILGTNKISIPYAKLKKGDHVFTIRATSTDGTMAGELNCSIKITESSFKRIEFVKPGLQAWFNMSRKTNQNIDRDYLDSEVLTSNGRRARLVLHDYNYASNGWIDGRLVNNGVSWAEIENYLPLEDNAESGFTFDIQFESFNAGDNDAKVIDCRGNDTPYVGFYIDSEKAGMQTVGNRTKTYYTDATNMRVTFVVNRTATYVDWKTGEKGNCPMIQTYINGIFTEVAMLTDSGSGGNKVYESIKHSNKILINTDKAKKLFGNNKIKTILIYNRALEHEEILQNLMADIDNIADQKAKYDKNYVTINQDIPTVYFKDSPVGSVGPMNKENKQWIQVTYVSPDVKKYGPSFDYLALTSYQGTSSLAYPIKNYKMKLYDYRINEQGEILDKKDNVITPEEFKAIPKYTKKKIDMYSQRDGTGYPENTFCLKADYMDSSHCRNTCTAKIVNDLVFKDIPNPARQKDPKTRETINGFLCQLYINGKWIGLYNFNLDKSCTKSLGFETIPNLVRWEIKANSETSPGAFNVTWNSNDVNDIYKKIMADFEIAYDEDAFVDETGEYDVTKYYDYLNIPHTGNVIGTYKDYAILSLARFIKFINDTDDKETFIKEGPKFFNPRSACRYYLNVMTMGMIDNFAKNCMINMYGDDIWWFGFYDMDSSMGLDNSGYNVFESDIEPSETTKVYNCSKSKMWVKLNKFMQETLFDEFKMMRESNYTYENLYKYLITDQIDTLPEIAYNKDQYTKYISQGKTNLFMLHGNNKDHLTRWLYNRFQYVDSLFLQYNSPYTKENITVRAARPDWVDYEVIKVDEHTEQHYWWLQFEIETYCPQYVTICWRKNTYETKRVGFNEKVIFRRQMVNDTDNEIILYCANNLKRIGDLTDMGPESLLLGSATKLVELKCQKAVKLKQADLSKNAYLKTVDFRDCSTFGELDVAKTMDVSSCTNLRKIDVRGTKLTAIKSNTDGGNLEEIYYPETIQNVVLSHQTNLRTVGLPYGYQNIWTGISGVSVKPNTSVSYSTLNGFTKNNVTGSYSILKNANSNTISEDNLWEITSGVKEIIAPVNGSTTEIYYFDIDKKFISRASIADTSVHSSEKIIEVSPPSNSAYCMITIRTVRPISLPSNIVNYALVEKGDRRFVNIQNLSNVQLSNCLNIEKLDLYSGLYDDGNVFRAISNVQTLTIDNSLNIEELYFQGFNKIREINIKNMLKMTDLGFDDMMDNTSIATLYDIKFTNCPLIQTLSMNVTDEDHSVRFAEDAKLDLSGLTSIKTFTTNYSIKGLRKIILPSTIKNILFTNRFGDNICDVKNIWSNECYHEADGFEGIDFNEMKLDTVDLQGLTYIEKGLNFNIAPTDKHPNLNKNRDGSVARPWFRPEGKIDLTNYLEDMTGMLKGIDITKCKVVINNPSKDQSDLTSLFENAVLDNINTVNNVISKFPKATTMDKLLLNSTGLTSIEGIQLPTNNPLTLSEAFKNMETITTDIQFSQNVTNVREAFRGCTGIKTIHANWNNEYTNMEDHEHCYRNCKGITTIDSAEGTLAEVPRLWGGYGFDNEVTMVAKINIELIGTKTISIADTEGETVHLYTDWGDGTIDDLLTHTYARNTEYTIKTQKISTVGIPFSESFKKALVSVSQMPNALTYYTNLFKGCINLTDANFKINNKTKSISGLFSDCNKLTGVSINLPTSCNDISNLFKDCSSLGDLDFIANWDVSKITTLSRTFYGCKSVRTIPVGNWNTSNVTTIYGVFQGCSAAETIDVSRWNTSKVTSASYAFNGCSQLAVIDVSNWSTSNFYGDAIRSIFNSCTSVEILDISNWKIDNITTLNNVFSGCSNVKELDVSKWNTSKVTNISGTFQSCSSVKVLDVSKWVTSGMTSYSYTFSYCSALTTLDLTNWSFANITTIAGMFSGCSELITLKLPNLSKNKIKKMTGTFQNCTKLKSIDLSTLNTSLLDDLQSAFINCENITEIKGIENFNTSKVTSLFSTFQSCYKLVSLDLSRWNVNLVKEMGCFASDCVSLTTLNIKGWKTSPLTSIYSAFQNCKNITELDVSGLDVSNSESLTSVFYGCESLESLDLSKWNVANTTTFDGLFQRCLALTNINLSGWITTKASTLSYMFSECMALTSLNLSTMDIINANDLNSSLNFTFNKCDLLNTLQPPKNINANITLPNNLSISSVKEVIANLNNRTSNTSATLKVGSNNMTLLEKDNDTLNMAITKNWSVVS